MSKEEKFMTIGRFQFNVEAVKAMKKSEFIEANKIHKKDIDLAETYDKIVGK